MAISDWETLVADKLQDTASKVSAAAIDRAITQAVKRYSRIRPRTKIAVLTGNGSTYLFAVPSDWQENFSRVLSIEYPVGRQDPEYLDDLDDYQVDDKDRDPSTSALRIRLITVVLPNAATARVAYTLLHSVVGGGSPADTVPIVDREACCALAAAYCCRALASYYAQETDSTMATATVINRDKPQIYEAQAHALEQEFNEFVGVPADGYAAASVSRDQDVDLESGAGDKFFHPRAFR